MSNLKNCKWCKESKDPSLFSKDRSRYDGLATECKTCQRRRGKIYYYKNQQHYKDRHLRRSYNITLEDYFMLAKAQDFKCKICSREMHKLAVDHCHKTGKLRGLLCRKCNLGIGHLKDSIVNLKRAIEYLEGKL